MLSFEEFYRWLNSHLFLIFDVLMRWPMLGVISVCKATFSLLFSICSVFIARGGAKTQTFNINGNDCKIISSIFINKKRKQKNWEHRHGKNLSTISTARIDENVKYISSLIIFFICIANKRELVSFYSETAIERIGQNVA